MGLLEAAGDIIPAEDNREAEVRDQLTQQLWEQVGADKVEQLTQQRRESLQSTINKLVDYKMEERVPVTVMGSQSLDVYGNTFIPPATPEDTVEDETIVKDYDPSDKWDPSNDDFAEPFVMDFESPEFGELPEKITVEGSQPIITEEEKEEVVKDILPTQEQLGINIEEIKKRIAEDDIYKITREMENNKTDPRGGWSEEKQKWSPHESGEGGLDTVAYGHKLKKFEVESGMIHGIDYTKGITDEQALEIYTADQADFLKHPDVAGMTNRQKTIAFDYWHRTGGAVKNWKAWQNILDDDYNMLWRNSGNIKWDNAKGEKVNYNSRNKRVFKSLGIWDHITDADKRANLDLAKRSNVIEG